VDHAAVETGVEARRLIRLGQWRRPTAGLAPGYVQANLIILPLEHAFHFLAWCTRNARPCPVLDVLEPGNPEPSIAVGADLRTDLPRYRVYRDGSPGEEVEDITALWRDDLTSFLLGCSYTFEAALVRAGVPVRHWDAGTNVPMYITNIPTVAAGPFGGPTVVSMRPVPGRLVARAVQVTSRFPGAHGAPVHVGTPADIGVMDLRRPDFGDPPLMQEGDVPVFWACGVTSQVALARARLPLFIGHSPGHMFVTDIRDEDLAVL
jgi:uncharacterized protein YcsI (UPF0317 family)